MTKTKYNEMLGDLLRARYKAEKKSCFGFVWYVLPNKNYVRLDDDNDSSKSKIIAIYCRKGSRWGQKMNFCEFKKFCNYAMLIAYLDEISK